MVHVLIIDNDRSVGEALQLMLERSGCSCFFALEAQAGFEACESEDFDLAFIDILMPEIDGLETIKRLRETRPRLPIVAMSGFRLRNAAALAPDLLEDAARLGATGRLPKPFSNEQLVAVLRSYVFAPAAALAL